MGILFVSGFNIFLTKASQAQIVNFDNWQVKDGLPQNSINHIVQGKDGYLWLATEGGLVRFDGVTFTTFDVQNTPEFKSNRIKTIFQNKNGDLLIGGYKAGVTLYRNGKFTNLSKELGIQNGSVQFFHLDKNNRIWISSSDSGAVVIDGSNYSLMPEFESLKELNILSISELQGKLYLFTLANFYQWDNGLKIQEDNPLGVNAGFIGPAVFDEEGRKIWVVSTGQLLKFDRNKLLKRYEIPDFQYDQNRTYKLSILNGEILISAREGSILFKFNIEKEAFSKEILSINCNVGAIKHIFIDQEKNKWYASTTCGLIKAKPNRFRYLEANKSQINSNLYAIFKASNGNLFLGTNGSGYYEVNMQTGEYFSSKVIEIANSYISSINEFNGSIYLGFEGREYIYKKTGNNYLKIEFPDKKSRIVKSVYKTKRNELLIGSNAGLFYVKQDSILPHPLSEKLFNNDVSAFIEDSLDNLWFINDFFIYCYSYKTGKLTKFGDAGKLKPTLHRGIYLDKQGRIYVGSYGYGLTVIEDGKRYTIYSSNGLPEQVVSSIIEDVNGNIWLTGNKGLTRLNKEELLVQMKVKNGVINASLFNENTDRLKSGEFNGGFQQSKCWMGGDVYLFPSISGCVRVDFADFKRNEIVPLVHIETMKYGDEEFTITSDSAIKLPYKEQRIDFTFTALSFVSPQNVRFKYQLVGYDKKWIEGGNERKTFYNKIPPGSYQFKVIACNNDGVWNETGATLSIEIVPPFYMTLWFRTLVVLLSLLLVGLAIFEYLNRIKIREREKSALMDILPDLVLKLDRNGKYLDIYGNSDSLIQPFEVLKGKTIREFLSEDLSNLLLEKFEEAFKHKTMQFFEYKLILSDGKEYSFEGRVIAKGQDEVLLIIRDITDATAAQLKILENEKALLKSAKKEKKLLEKINEQQKQQLEAIINTEEKERRRIATDLHDGIGQLLTFVKINLELAKEHISEKEKADTQNLIMVSKDTIDQITNEIRNISYNLLPPSLEQFGLASAIDEELKKLKGKPELEISFFSNVMAKKVDQKVEIVLFRSFQEILNNALKHAAAKEITVQLMKHDEKLMLMIEDNGRGFNYTEAYKKKDSSGLKNLYSRIALINGEIRIDSNHNSGTSIIIEVPITNEPT